MILKPKARITQKTTRRKHNMKTFRRSFVGIALSVFALAVVPVASVSAVTADTVINGTVNGAISIATSGSAASGTVTIPAVTPTSGGNASVASETVTVTTNNTSGYDLTLSMSSASADNALHSGANSLPAGTVASPSSWGFSTSSATLSDQPVGSLTGTFQPVPMAAAPASLKSTAAAAITGDTTSVYYGLSADSSQPSGVYTGTVTYTATVKN